MVQARVKPIITVDGMEFRDLNANGSLDAYEDWRLDVDQRVADLVSRMSLEEKAGLMLIDTLNAGCDGVVADPADDYLNNQQMHRFIFRNSIDETPVCQGGRSGATITAEQAATYTNAMQELSEGTRLGIPALFKSNARNHIDPDARFGINENAGVFSAFPKEAGIAAAALGSGDTERVVGDFATVMGAEWHAIGLRGMYGYMADLSTEPRWYRVHETFTEDASLASDIMRELVGTLQGPVDRNGVSLSPDSDVALTMKHFPGGGPQELGLDPHYSFGKTQVYTDGGFEYALQPFEAAIDAGVSAIMPYYGVPMNVTHDGVTYSQTGFAFSDEIVNGLLRDELGFAGYVNSDTGIINSRAWGLEHNTVPERVAAAINGGTDTLSGFHDVQVILDLVDEGLITSERVDLAAQRLLTPMFQLGLFENPYVDASQASRIIGSAQHSEVALQTQRDSLVLLQNENDLLPLRSGTTVFVLGAYDVDVLRSYGLTVIDGNTEGIEAAADADIALIKMSAATNAATRDYDSREFESHPVNPIRMPGDGGYVPGLDGQSNYGASDECVWQGSAECTDSTLMFGGSLPWESGVLDFTGMTGSQSWTVTPALSDVQAVMAAVGAENTVLDIYFRQPYVLDQASGLRDAGAIVANFGVTDPALLDVLTGEQDFVGRLPFALPATVEAVERQASDRPGYDEVPGGTLFGYGHGLRYNS